MVKENLNNMEDSEGHRLRLHISVSLGIVKRLVLRCSKNWKLDASIKGSIGALSKKSDLGSDGVCWSGQNAPWEY